MVRFAPFFFFFFEFRPESANTALVGPIQCESAQVGAALTRVGLKKTKAMWHDAARRAGSSVPHASPRPATSNAGAAPEVLRPCFTGCNTPSSCNLVTSLYPPRSSPLQ